MSLTLFTLMEFTILFFAIVMNLMFLRSIIVFSSLTIINIVSPFPALACPVKRLPCYLTLLFHMNKTKFINWSLDLYLIFVLVRFTVRTSDRNTHHQNMEHLPMHCRYSQMKILCLSVYPSVWLTSLFMCVFSPSLCLSKLFNCTFQYVYL